MWLGDRCSPTTASTGRPLGTGWPVSFFVVTLIFLAYLLSGAPELVRRRAARSA